MAAITRLRLMVSFPLALGVLAACTPDSDPARTVERGAGVESVPAQPAGEAMQMQPAQPVEGGMSDAARPPRAGQDGEEAGTADPAATVER